MSLFPMDYRKVGVLVFVLSFITVGVVLAKAVLPHL